MIKKLLALLTAISVLSSVFAVSAFALDANDVEYEEPEKIVISFRLGDSVLSINGNDVAVTTPYEINGTTLVPLRVITEAFGADVVWDDADQGVTLTYGDVVIEIWIGRTDALVNGQTLPLLLAPELTNDTTMVPLRFITENFGAEVSYDEATEAILVEKYVTQSNSVVDYAAVLNNTQNEYVGDSYQGWMMKYDKDLMLSNRTFTGNSNEFVNTDQTAVLFIDVMDIDESETLDSIYQGLKTSAGNYTIIDQGKDTDADGNEYAYFELRNSDLYIIEKIYVRDNKMYLYAAYIDNDEASNLTDTYRELFDSFTINYTDTDTADLSDVVDGYRTYENNDMKLSIDVPADWADVSNENVLNIFNFVKPYDYDIENIFEQESISVYVITPDTSLDEWLESDKASYVSEVNPSYYETSETQTRDLNGKQAKYYTVEKDLENGDRYVRTDLFLLNGDYGYNVCVQTIENGEENVRTERILNSFECEELDSNEVGRLMRSDYSDDNKTVTLEDAGFSVTVPYSWEQQDTGYDDVASFAGTPGQITIYISDNVYTDTGELARSLFNGIEDSNENDPQMITSPTLTEINGINGYYFDYTEVISDVTLYSKIFCFKKDGKMFVAHMRVFDELHGEKAEQILADAVNVTVL